MTKVSEVLANFMETINETKAVQRLKQYQELVTSDRNWYYQPMVYKLTQNLSWDVFHKLIEDLDEDQAVFLVLLVAKLSDFDVSQTVAKVVHPLDVDGFCAKCFPELYSPVIEDWYID